jgi:hypothetical protein
LHDEIREDSRATLSGDAGLQAVLVHFAVAGRGVTGFSINIKV